MVTVTGFLFRILTQKKVEKDKGINNVFVSFSLPQS
jgi:hypothetical protein